MADFANALVKFKIKPEFKDAFKYVFERMNNPSLDLDYLDYGFNHITTDGTYLEEYDEDYDYLPDILRVGCNYNLEGNFSIDEDQGIKEDIVTLKFSAKWYTITRLKHDVALFLDYVAEEVVFCEMIGLEKINFSSEDLGEDEYYHWISFKAIEGDWGIEFEEVERKRIE